MSKGKVLVVSGDIDAVSTVLKHSGYEVEVFYAGEERGRQYRPDLVDGQRLERMVNAVDTSNNPFVGYVLANNRQAGRLLATYIPLEQRDRTVVVWHDQPSTEEQERYREVGYQHFSKRLNAAVVLDEMLRE